VHGLASVHGASIFGLERRGPSGLRVTRVLWTTYLSVMVHENRIVDRGVLSPAATAAHTRGPPTISESPQSGVSVESASIAS